MTQILEGKPVADYIFSKCNKSDGKELAIITIGYDKASEIYVRNKIKDAEKLGLKGVNYTFTSKDNNTDIGKLIVDLNQRNDVIGIIVQKPYPVKFKGIENYIDPDKDVDGLTEYNMYDTLRGEKPIHYPATPLGIMFMLDYYKIPIEGKNVVIIGRSDIVGKPLAAMMTARNATVTLCHSKSKKIRWFTLNADIIVSAVGKPKFINKNWINSVIKPIIIDVGINYDENGKLCGDVDFDDSLSDCGAITPVPGGVGLITRAALIYNCLKEC